MNLIEAYEQLNIINEDIHLTEATKSSAQLRPHTGSDMEQIQALLIKVSNSLAHNLVNAAVVNVKTGETGVISSVPQDNVEVVARVIATKELAPTRSNSNNKIYNLAGTGSEAKHYAINLVKNLTAIVQPEPVLLAQWRSITPLIRFKFMVKWDKKPQPEAIPYYIYSIAEHDTIDSPENKMQTVYVENHRIAKDTNNTIKYYNQKIGTAFQNNTYWKAYKDIWDISKSNNRKSGVAALKIRAKKHGWTSLSKEEIAEVKDYDKEAQEQIAKVNSGAAAFITPTAAGSTAQSTDREHDFWYTIGWLAKHVTKLIFSCPIPAIDIWQTALGDSKKDKITNRKPAGYKDSWNWAELTNGNIILDTPAASDPVVGRTLQSWINMANAQKKSNETQTGPLTASKKEINSWRIVKDLVTQFGFQLSSYQQITDDEGDPIKTTYHDIKQDISEIVPVQAKQSEAFYEGYNA